MKIVAGTLALGLIGSPALAAWTAHGPYGGAVYFLDQQGNVLRIATADGIYQSSDGAANWSRLGDIPRGTTIRYVAADPGNAAIILAANGATVYRSTDGGAHFSAGGPPLVGTVFQPVTPNEVLGTDLNSTALYRSADAGQTWGTVTFPGGAPISAAGLVGTPNGHTFYMSTRDGNVYQSVDGGLQWTLVGNDPHGTPVSLIPDPYDVTGDVMLWSDAALDVGRAVRFQISSQTLSIQITNDRTGAMRADRTTPGRFWYEGVNQGGYGGPIGNILYESTDHGASFHSVSAMPGHLLAPDPVTAGLLYGTDAQGFAVSTDAGLTWHSRVQGILSSATTAVSVRPDLISEVLAAGAGFGVDRSTDGGASWQASANGLTQLHVNTLARSPLDPLTVYAGSDDGLFVSNDGGRNWSAIAISTFPFGGARKFAHIEVDAANPNRLVAIANSNTLAFSTDAGANWHAAATSDGAFDLRIVPHAAAGTRQVYALAWQSSISYLLYRAPAHNTTLAPSAGGLLLSAVAVRQDSDNTLIAFSPDFANGRWLVYRSRDSGDHWQARGSISLPNLGFEPQLSFDPCNPRAVHALVGTSFYVSPDEGMTWSEDPLAAPSQRFNGLDARCMSGNLVEAAATDSAGAQQRTAFVDQGFKDGFEAD